MARNYQQHLHRKRLRKLLIFGVGLGLVLGSRISIQLSESNPPDIERKSPNTQMADRQQSNFENWLEIVQRLDTCRATALQNRSLPMLENCLQVDSAAYVSDAALIEYLIKTDVYPRGYKLIVRSAELIGSGRRAGVDVFQLTVIDSLESYELVYANGEEVFHAGRGEVKWRLSLAKFNKKWLITDVARF